MNPVSIETFMAVLIVAYLFMGGAFMASQKQGETFIASFDKAMAWGSGLFVMGYCLDAVAYVAWI